MTQAEILPEAETAAPGANVRENAHIFCSRVRGKLSSLSKK